MNQHSIVTEPISPYMPSRPSHTIQSMALGISANASIENNNSPGNNSYFSEIQMDDGKWTRHQTQVLIDTWKEHKDILLSTASSSAEHFRVWKLIATEVNKYAPPKSLQQCKKKFRNIRYICKMAMNNNKQEGGKKHYPMFYSDFLEIIAETERIKEGIKNESPNVEILSENSKESELCVRPYSNQSPPEEGHYDNRGGRSPSELNIRRSEEYSEENRSQGNIVSTSDGSYNGSPQSREFEEFPSTSPNLQSATETGDRPLESITDLRNGGVTESENGHNRLGERLSSYYSRHEPIYPPSIYSNRPDHLMRKHKNIDVSIMGHGYPTAKRMRKTMEFYSTQPPAPYKYSPRGQRGYPPTMATISGNTYPYTLNSHYSTTPPLIRPLSTPKDTSPPPRYIVASSSANISVPNSEVSYKDASAPIISDENVPPLKSSPGLKTPTTSIKNAPKDLTLAEGLNYYNQRFLDIQERQTELFSEMLCRHEQFLLRLLQQQREAAEEAQKRDREFMLKLIEMFVKQK